ncbi:unnamed protein product (mitochondrion) [Plasmodiophora brassicae]|uniref:Uncharacterized protein n=1 Tax=Plasmodiophora brassicae TaxID=37360 RepID=A0A3P3Y6C1_PLABS|nr:unnamed protein product [Plasmodiophora brassicae]
MADVTARLVSALVTRLSPEGADETTRRERALLAVRLLCSRIRPRVSLDPVHVRHLIASLLARNRISTIAFDELFEKLMRMRVIEHKASVLYLMRVAKKMQDREASERAREEAIARAALAGSRILRQFASQLPRERCSKQELFAELLSLFDPELFTNEAADTAARMLWAHILPGVRAPSPSSTNPQRPSSPQSPVDADGIPSADL